jgi:small GTP-binding protein
MEEIKLVIAGLDNAGKTSALIALRHKYNFHERVKNLKPTIKVDYSTFDLLNHYRINIWDMGGQEKFRKIYLNTPIYFEETDYLYFLIDIQDEFKYEEAIKYLHDVLDIYRQLKYNHEVIICFNKYDPEFINNSDFIERSNMIKNLIYKHNDDMQFRFFNTSYYDISSISRAMSYSMNKVSKLEKLSDDLKNMAEKYQCEYIILYTENGIIVSDVYNNTMDMRKYEEQINDKISDDLAFFQRLKDQNVKIDDKVNLSNDRIEYVKKYVINFNEKPTTFYLGISTNAESINDIKIELEMIPNVFKQLTP